MLTQTFEFETIGPGQNAQGTASITTVKLIYVQTFHTNKKARKKDVVIFIFILFYLINLKIFFII